MSPTRIARATRHALILPLLAALVACDTGANDTAAGVRDASTRVDGADASTDSPDGAPVSDECPAQSTCGTCTGLGVCGFCASTGRCVKGALDGPSAGTCADWRYVSYECTINCARSTTCGACTGAQGCGWCRARNACLRGDSEGSRDGACQGSNWVFTSDQCVVPDGG